MRRVGSIPALLIVMGAFRPAAQLTAVDQGRFTITRAGAPFGTETFTVTPLAAPEGLTYTLKGTRSVSGRQIVTTLRTDSLGVPITYLRRQTGDSVVTITAGRASGRLTVNRVQPDRHGSRDYPMKAGTLLLDEDLIHQFVVVCLNDVERSIPYVSPAAGVLGSGDLALVGPEEVTLGNKTTVVARHFTFGSGAAARHIWIDSNRRLLKVSIPGRRIEALRDEPPR